MSDRPSREQLGEALAAAGSAHHDYEKNTFVIVPPIVPGLLLADHGSPWPTGVAQAVLSSVVSKTADDWSPPERVVSSVHRN